MTTVDWSKAPEEYDFHIQWNTQVSNFYRDDGDRYTTDQGYYALKSDLVRMPEVVVTRRPAAPLPAIDWSKAPKGATHNCGGVWYKQEFEKVFYCSKGQWLLTALPPERLEGSDVMTRPTAPTWNGEGLPPVGTYVEVRFPSWANEELWLSGTLKYIDERHAIVQHDHGPTEHYETAKFLWRPAKTPEQMAAKERYKAVKEMAEDLGVMHTTAAQAYDKGYRKVEKP